MPQGLSEAELIAKLQTPQPTAAAHQRPNGVEIPAPAPPQDGNSGQSIMAHLMSGPQPSVHIGSNAALSEEQIMAKLMQPKPTEGPTKPKQAPKGQASANTAQAAASAPVAQPRKNLS